MVDVFDPWCQLSIVANLAVVAGYLAVPMTALRLVPMRTRTRVAGVVFFVTCAITHAFMAFAGADHGQRTPVFWLMLVNHLVQAAAVWMFVLGLAAEVRTAVAVRKERWKKTPSAEVHRDDLPHGQ